MRSGLLRDAALKLATGHAASNVLNSVLFADDLESVAERPDVAVTQSRADSSCHKRATLGGTATKRWSTARTSKRLTCRYSGGPRRARTDDLRIKRAIERCGEPRIPLICNVIHSQRLVSLGVVWTQVRTICGLLRWPDTVRYQQLGNQLRFRLFVFGVILVSVDRCPAGVGG